MKLLIPIIASILLLSGCATCQEHKTACAVGAVVVGGAVVAAAASHSSGSSMSRGY